MNEVRITYREMDDVLNPELFWFTVRMKLRSAGIDPDGPLIRYDGFDHIVFQKPAGGTSEEAIA